MKKRLIYIIGLLLLLLSPVRSEAQIYYQYWIDDDTGNAVGGSTTDGASLNLNIDVADLSPGVHFCNIRAYKDKWGAVYRYLFSIPRAASAASSQLKNYEYWLDNDYANRVITAASGEEQSIVLSLDVSSLSPGVHFLNMRSQDATGQWGSVSRSLFSIPREAQTTGKLINGYRYSFNGQTTAVSVTPTSEYTLIQNIDIPAAPLPMTIDDDCQFSFSGDEATLLRNIDMNFSLTFVDQSESTTLPIGTSFTVADTHTSAIATLSVPGALTVNSHAEGGYNVMKFDLPENMECVLKSSVACSMRIYSSTGTYLATVSADALAAGYTPAFEAGTYYAVAYGNTQEVKLTVNATDVSKLKPTLTYADDKVTISSSVAGATFYYTTNGSNPTTESTVYKTPITVDRNMTIKAIAVWSGVDPSPMATLEIDLFTVEKPVFGHNGNIVSISTSTANAVIHYTIDGTIPSQTSTVYTGSLELEENCTVKAIAIRDGYHDSAVESLVVNWIVPPPPCGYAVLDPTTGTLTFKYGKKPKGDNIFETDDTHFDQDHPAPWDNPSLKSVVFDESFANARPKSTAYWFYNASQLTSITGLEYLNTSEVTNMSHMFAGCTKLEDIDVSHLDTGKVTDMSGMFEGCSGLPTSVDMTYANGVVVISSTLAGATFYYTLDGKDPTTKSTVYEAPITVDRNMTIKAIAVWTGIGAGPVKTLTINEFTVAKPVLKYEYNKVSISTTTANAVIHYTIDGTTPNQTSTVYTDGFKLSDNCTVKAIAIREGYNASEISSLVVNWIIKGDANLSGKVDAEDIEEVVNYIMGSPSGKFNFATADMNNDNKVNATDLVLLVNAVRLAK